jgi:hypothetical protein
MPNPDISVVTTYFLLPHTVNLDRHVVWGTVDGGAWPGWTDADVGRLVAPWEPPAGRRPVCRIELRDAPGGRSSVGAVYRRFPDLVDRHLSGRRRGMRRAATLGGSWRWRREPTTAAAVSLIAPDRLAAGASPSEVRTARIEECLRVLGFYLSALGMASNDPLVGELTLGDVTGTVEFVSELRDPTGHKHDRDHQRVAIHLWQREILGLPRDPDHLEYAASLFRAGREGVEVAYPVLALRHAATREVLAGRRDYAVLLLTSAIEVLVDLTIDRAWTLLALPAGDQADARDDPLVRKLTTARDRMFPGATGLGPAIDDWTRDCYEARKRIIHSGCVPTHAESSSAPKRPTTSSWRSARPLMPTPAPKVPSDTFPQRGSRTSATPASTGRRWACPVASSRSAETAPAWSGAFPADLP